MTPVATVCVPTYNRADSLDRLLGSLAGQDISGFEVVVYDDASTDRTAQVLAAWKGRLPLTVLVGDSNRGPAAGRNAALRAARAPLVLFTDDDCVPGPGWVRAHLEAAGPITVGRTVPAPDQLDRTGPFSRTLAVDSVELFHTCNIGYPRSLLLAVGGFDERYRKAAGEDTDLGLRALRSGAEAVFVPAAVVEHDVRPSSWPAALRETGKWVDVPLFARTHGADNAAVYSRWWWRKTHPAAAAAVVGLLIAPRFRWAVLAALPWFRLRTGELRVQARRRHWPWVLPAQLAIDAAEVVVLARGSVRHRRLLL
jgi:glycosyltransferase involved in cell wall biosynthesis